MTSGEPEDCCNAGHILREAEKDCRNLRKALTNLLDVLRSDPLHEAVSSRQLGEEPGYRLYTCMRDGDDALEGIPID